VDAVWPCVGVILVGIDPGECGCGIADTDTDEDGVPDCRDLCPGTVVGENDEINDDGCVDLTCTLSLLDHYMAG
jgi:hypothetical protein